jgi:nicotinamide-nucleotide adenylyltransferase
MKIIRDALKQDKEIVIAVGSASKKNEKNNPFSGEERKQMIEKTLAANQISAKVVLIPNIPSDQHYVDHVEEQIQCRPKKVITENPWSIDLFTRSGYEVQVTDRHFEISATDIRERIADDKPWQDLVPIEVVRFIEDIDGIKRIKELHIKEHQKD